MKGFLIFVLVVVGAFAWTKNWVVTGQMDAYIAAHPGESTPDILYWIAEAYYMADNPTEANRYYAWIVKDYPRYGRIPKVRWQWGQCLEQVGQRPAALEQYVILKSSYSDTEEGKLGEGRYGQLKY